jgi:hypothetical protein
MALDKPNSFNYKFPKIKYLSIKEPKDEAFKLITWQLCKDENTFVTVGFLQLNRSKSTVYKLTDNSQNLNDPENGILKADTWFGATYFNIVPFKGKEETQYLLFGFNANNSVERIKVCDVLTLKSGQPRFGAEVFNFGKKKPKKTPHRLVLTYASEAVVRFNYDAAMEQIVFDHLTQTASSNPNIPFVFIPDGTYEAFEFKKGEWRYIEKIENTIMDEAPRPAPILGAKAKVVDKDNAKKFERPKRVEDQK